MGRRREMPRGLSLQRDLSVPEDSQWDDAQERSRREGERYQDLSAWGQGVHCHMSQWEDRRELELSQVRDSSGRELCQGADAAAQELPRWDDVRERKLSQREEDVSRQELSRWGHNISSEIWDRPLCPVRDEEPQPCPPEGPSSASPVGTEVAAEAVPALTSASPAPQSPTEAEPAAAAPAGAAEEEEEPGWAVLALAGPVLSQHWSLEALAPDSDWSSDSEEEEGEVEPELSQGTVSLIQELSQGEDDVSSSSGEKPVGPVKEGDTQPSPPEGPGSASPVGTEVAAEAAPALPSTSPLPSSPTEAEPAAAAPSGAAEEAAAGSGLAVQERTDDDDDDEMKFWQYLDDLAPFLVGDPELSQEASYYQQYREEDLPHGVVMSYHQLFDWEKYLEQDLSQGEVSSSQGPSDWEEYPEQVLCGGDVISCEELSDWEEHLGQKVSRGNGSRPSGLSSWGDDSDTGLVQENWPQHVILAKPLCPEDDEWDDVSLLELPPEDGKHQKRKVLVAEGLPVPVPREAWAECPAQEPCSQGPAPAPHSPPSPWPARLGAQALRGQPAAPRKRPSRFRRALRALRGLFRCPCLRPRTEE